MERILVIGSPGAGKTTLARQLAEKLNLPLVHLDALYWQDNWHAVAEDTFDALLMAELQKKRWILDGNYNRTLPLRLVRCDTVVYLDYSRFTCLCGAVRRIIAYHGHSRPDMGANCPERFDAEFLKYIWDFNRCNRTRYYAMLRRETAKTIVILRNRKDAANFLLQL